MIRLFLLLSALLLATACSPRPVAQLPPMIADGDAGTGQQCAELFPSGPWQFAHSIDFTAAGGYSGALLGVTVVDAGSLRCALLTVEGVTLFEGVLDGAGKMQIIRSVPPFTGDGFAAGLLADVQTIFVAPDGTAEAGRLADGSPVCRFVAADGRIVSVLPAADGWWRVRAADHDGTIRADVTGRAVPGGGIAGSETIELNSYRQGGYRLKLTLLEATPLQ